MCEYFLLIPIHVPSFKLIEGQIKELQGLVPNTPPRAENDQKSPGRIGLIAILLVPAFQIDMTFSISECCSVKGLQLHFHRGFLLYSSVSYMLIRRVWFFEMKQAVLRELSFFSSRGGGGGVVETGWKTLLNFWSPLEAAEKLLIPLSICKNFMWPPLKSPPPKVCWVYNDVVPTCKGHCPCQLGVWGCCKVPRAEP